VSRVTELIRTQREHPVAVSCWAAVGMIVASFAAFVLAWRGSASTLSVPVQLSYLLSGGLGGLCLLIAGSALLNVQLSRWWAARERQGLDVVLNEARETLEAAGWPSEPAREQ
jgi:hypothetical protein